MSFSLSLDLSLDPIQELSQKIENERTDLSDIDEFVAHSHILINELRDFEGSAAEYIELNELLRFYIATTVSYASDRVKKILAEST
ncbi:hypothetical protein PCE1_000882 [Barthelona sp. PCE]